VRNKILSQQSDNSFSPRIILYKNNSHKTVITDPYPGEIICSNCGIVISDKIQESDNDLTNSVQHPRLVQIKICHCV
jgi:hypothetical protein